LAFFRLILRFPDHDAGSTLDRHKPDAQYHDGIMQPGPTRVLRCMINPLGGPIMSPTSRRSVLAATGLLTLGLAGCGNTQGPVAASTTAGSKRATIEAEARAALADLYRTRPGARQLGDRARAILVFPTITQAGLGVGGLYGNGVMLEGDRVTGYYNIAGGTFGFQIGGQSFSQAYFFNTAEALETFRKTKGFELGAGVTAVAADFGASGELSTATLQKPLVVVSWGQSGLMAGLTIEGAKITEINP
jgi:lipid-binding SYLF domain-containing protein